MRKYCEEIAAKAWQELARSNLVTAEKLKSVPEIRFVPLGDKFLGRAYADYIELHEKYLHTDEPERLKMVLLHEVAHVAEFRCTGIMGHGPLWHAICLYIGGSGDAQGDLPPDADRQNVLPQNTDSETNDIIFGFAAVVALAGTLFCGMYVSFHWLGIANKIICGACGIGGIVLSLVLWASCCKTFEQVQKTVVLQAVLTAIFAIGVLL
ncbi:MAG: SprT-like domain-containing protein [Lentisphaeria bacterium]|nr:SprT-like domain-containing protein [Lentisphaeria bacterium]